MLHIIQYKEGNGYEQHIKELFFDAKKIGENLYIISEKQSTETANHARERYEENESAEMSLENFEKANYTGQSHFGRIEAHRGL